MFPQQCVFVITALDSLQSLRGRAKAAEERLAAAQSAAEFAARQAPGRAVVDHRVAQLEQQLMHAQESCRS